MMGIRKEILGVMEIREGTFGDNEDKEGFSGGMGIREGNFGDNGDKGGNPWGRLG